mgnify:CR=1 FL=1
MAVKSKMGIFFEDFNSLVSSLKLICLDSDNPFLSIVLENAGHPEFESKASLLLYNLLLQQGHT